MIKSFNANELKTKCLECRKLILQLTLNCGITGAHIGGAMSLVEIMGVLYNNILNIDVKDPYYEGRDRLILSKGHGTMALFTSLYVNSYISYDELVTYKKNGSLFSVHPQLNQEKFVEFSSGSLGQGLSLGVGVALALKKKNNNKSNVYVVLGDGECNEGQIWEAAESANHFNLNNLVVIVDKNGIQNDGYTDKIMVNEPFDKKWESFGFNTKVINGHNCEEIYKSLVNRDSTKPYCIIANTIKGKGISFIENNYEWHNHSLTKEQYVDALKELDCD